MSLLVTRGMADADSYIVPLVGELTITEVALEGIITLSQVLTGVISATTIELTGVINILTLEGEVDINESLTGELECIHGN